MKSESFGKTDLQIKIQYKHLHTIYKWNTNKKIKQHFPWNPNEEMTWDLFWRGGKKTQKILFVLFIEHQLKCLGIITLPSHTYAHMHTHPCSFRLFDHGWWALRPSLSRQQEFVFIFKHTLNAGPLRFSASNEAINFQKAIHMPRKSMLMVGKAQPRSCT